MKQLLKRQTAAKEEMIGINEACELLSLAKPTPFKRRNTAVFISVLLFKAIIFSFMTLISLLVSKLTVNILYLQYVILLMYYKIKKVKGLTKYREIRNYIYYSKME